MKHQKLNYCIMTMSAILISYFSADKSFSQPNNILYVKHHATGASVWQDRSPVYTSITEAIRAASAGAEIWVSAGRYRENIELKEGIKLYGGFEGTEISLAQRHSVWNNIASTTIDGNGRGRCILAACNNLIDGFKLIHGREDWGAGIGISNATDIEIRNVFIESCTVSWAGAGIFVDSPHQGGHILVENVVMWKCDAYCGVFEITEATSATVIVRQCTIVQNHAKGLEIPYHDDMVPANNFHKFYNNIIWGNHCSTYPTAQVDVWCWARDYADYSYIGKAPWQRIANKWNSTLPHNLFESKVGQPGFVDPDSGDFRLVATSPCIGSGKDRANMGALPVIKSTTPILKLDCTGLDFGDSQSSLTFTIDNRGSGILSWEASENPDQPWITAISPGQGNLYGGTSQTISVIVNRNYLDQQHQTGKIIVSSNGGKEALTINISMTPVINNILRVNCGSEANYVDREGKVWGSDRRYSTGSWGYIGGNVYATTDPIANTSDDYLCQTERWGLDGYQFDVENGDYEVTLHFAEIYFNEPNKRIFDVRIEDNLVLKNFHLFEAGGHDYAITKTINIAVRDNQLNISFIKSIEEPTISGIQVKRVKNSIGLNKISQVTNQTNANELPEGFKLNQNYPNPFNNATQISFEIPTDCQVEFLIYNITGQVVQKILDKNLHTGKYQLAWDGKDNQGQVVNSGIYFGVLKAGEFQRAITLTLLK